MPATNPYCEVLGMEVPRLETLRGHRDANYYSLLLAALLERGEPITLKEAAQRFEEAGIAPAEAALASLSRCKPARPPIYRQGERYALDPHDDGADLWAFRLGLRPPRVNVPMAPPPDQGPLPSPDSPLGIAHLDEAWRDGVPWAWSAQRVAICVLDAHPDPMNPEAVVAFVKARSRICRVSAESAQYWRAGAMLVLDDGRWALDREHSATRSARLAVRARVEMLRRWAGVNPDPVALEAAQKRLKEERAAHGAKLAAMRRVIVHAFPAAAPKAVVLLDVNRREIKTYLDDELAGLADPLAGYEMIAAVNVRTLLAELGFEPGQRPLGELEPPRKTRQLNRQGRTLKITLDLLVRGTCGISRPFGSARALGTYLRTRQLTKFRRRLEADVKSLYALYQYGRLHGGVRLRWGFLDEMIPAPWVHSDERRLHHLMEEALSLGRPLEIVTGSAPGWADPWSRRKTARVLRDKRGWQYWLQDESGLFIDEREVQLARVALV